MVRIIHCIIDDKFVDSIIRAVDLTTKWSHHDFVYITNEKNTSFQYIKFTDRITILTPNEFLSNVNSGKYHAIILHSLSSLPTNVINQLNDKIIVIWKAWGFDLYNTPLVNHPFIKLKKYKPLTKKVVSRNIKAWVQQINAALYYYIHKENYEKSIARIDYFSGVLPTEYELMKTQVPYFRAKQIHYYYGPISIYNKDRLCEPFSDGLNIMIGNSGDPTNNHLDAFELLSKLYLKDSKIYSPLSYGGNPLYLKKVIERGKELWGERFYPITSFLPYTEYSKLAWNCGIVLFNHERQQAIGNILMALWRGAKVFLSPTSVAYSYYKSVGMNVFNIEEDLTITNLTTPLTDTERNNNRVLINSLYSWETQERNFQNIYSLIDKNSKYDISRNL